MSIISITAEVSCDGKDCKATAISSDVFAQTIRNDYGYESAETVVHPPDNWKCVGLGSMFPKYYCPECSKKIKNLDK